ncbi:MAG: polysaccharide deacetylase family protein [Rhodococcus sp.]|nr:polysaccharide deacetylase family protein [Rhodococcus sp. (in: high G+C Gram-positive bacteria)]
MNSRTYQLFGDIVSRVETGEKLVALTFDDGPTDRTPEVLRVLAEADVPATFYVEGDQLRDLPEFGRQIVAAGHELGNHTASHRRMVFVGTDTVRREIETTDAAIRDVDYEGPITFRPPYGKKLYTLPRYLADHDRTTVTWDVEPDSAGSATTDDIVGETLDQVRPGSIVLLHVMYPSREASLAAVPQIVAGLKDRGYSFATVSQLLASR